MTSVAAWAELSDGELLERRISSLELTLEEVQPMVEELWGELTAKGLAFLPPCFVGDEWFCPVGIPAIFIPFYLMHERLRRLERTMMLEVEGESRTWFMQLLRHETGHAYAYAYQLFRRKKWQQQFGRTSREETPDTYRPRPYSRSFVVHLPDWYAQSHPDEDFAETFAVWLTPGLDWHEKYRGWKALQKLEYVDDLMKSIAGKPPAHTPEFRASDHDGLRIKLKTYYARKRRLWQESYPDFYDEDLRKLFREGADEGAVSASSYLRGRRSQILRAVCSWTNEKRYRVNGVLARLIERCDELGLRLRPEAPGVDLQVAAFITTLVMNHLFTGHFKRSR